MTEQPPCGCRGHAWENSARACYTLRYYGVAGLGAPDYDEDDGECECPCHDDDWEGADD